MDYDVSKKITPQSSKVSIEPGSTKLGLAHKADEICALFFPTESRYSTNY